MQKGVRILPGAWPILSQETPIHAVEDSKGAGRRGGIPENQFNHSAGTPAKLLAETKLRDWEETNKKCHFNPGRGPGWVNNGTCNPGVSQENDLL